MLLLLRWWWHLYLCCWLLVASAAGPDKCDEGADRVCPQPEEAWPNLRVLPVPVIEDASYAEFVAEWSRTEHVLPLVFSSSMLDVMAKGPYTRSELDRVCGQRPLQYMHCMQEANSNSSRQATSNQSDPVNNASSEHMTQLPIGQRCHSVRVVNQSLLGEEWAALQYADLDILNISTLHDLLAIQDTPRGEMLYLHDAPLTQICPDWLPKLKVPKFFPWDLRLFTAERNRSFQHHSHPSLFVSKQGTGSPLHADSGCTRFYMTLLTGAKKWRLSPPYENWRFGPSFTAADWYPNKFEGDLFAPNLTRFPDMGGAVVYETVLHPGQVIFVPEMWPHQVVNLEDSIGYSYNWLDQDTLPSLNQAINRPIAHFRQEGFDEAADNLVSSRRRLNSFLFDFDHPHPARSNLAWADFFRAHVLSESPVSRGLYNWLASNHVDAPVNSDFRTALHQAVQYNMTQSVHTLLRQGARADVRDSQGAVPLDMLGLHNDGIHCLKSCQNKAGPCVFCGSGSCCRKDEEEGGCPSYQGGEGKHICVPTLTSRPGQTPEQLKRTLLAAFKTRKRKKERRKEVG